jgi:ABC-2 type transport system permease protein
MNLQRFIAVARKEFIHVIRDWRSLVLAIAIPIFLIALFGYALTMDLKHVPTAVWDQSRTAESRRLLSLLDGSAYFSVERHADSYRDLSAMLDAGSVMVALVIPANFADRSRAGRKVVIQAMVDGSDANNATLAMGYINAIGQIYNKGLTVKGTNTPGSVGRVTLEPRAWYNPDMDSRNVVIPGIIALVMVVIAAMLTSVTVAREWETGTMEQLISTPIRVPELVLGKVVPYFAIGLADVAIAVAMGRLIFDVPLRGSTGLLFL